MRYFFLFCHHCKKNAKLKKNALFSNRGRSARLRAESNTSAAELNLEHPTCMGCSSSSSKSGATPPDVNAYGEDMDASMHEYDMARRTESSACTSALART